MKPVTIQILFAICCLLLLDSCSVSNNVVSSRNIQKRKYNKGWHFSKSKMKQTCETKLETADFIENKSEVHPIIQKDSTKISIKEFSIENDTLVSSSKELKPTLDEGSEIEKNSVLNNIKNYPVSLAIVKVEEIKDVLKKRKPDPLGLIGLILISFLILIALLAYLLDTSTMFIIPIVISAIVGIVFGVLSIVRTQRNKDKYNHIEIGIIIASLGVALALLGLIALVFAFILLW